jgi:DNA-binding protein YbaB
MDPEKWFAQYDEKLKAAAASANKAEQALKEVGGSATSQDGDVTVRVTANGGLSDLVLRPGVSDLEPEQLAKVILETSRKAQRDAGQQVVDVMTKFVGEGAALDAVREYLPQGFTNDGRDNPMDLVQRSERKPRSDDEYFDSPPEVIKEY